LNWKLSGQPENAPREQRPFGWNAKSRTSDGFAIDLAMDSAEHILVTADYDFKVVADLTSIQFLPAK
jgi:hypothetical protein